MKRKEIQERSVESSSSSSSILFSTAYENISTIDSSLIHINITEFEAVARASGCTQIINLLGGNITQWRILLNLALILAIPSLCGKIIDKRGLGGCRTYAVCFVLC